MLHQWLNIAGLTFDFFGVLLLAYEWWIALKADEREAEIAARENMFKRSPMMPGRNDRTQAVFDHMDEQMRFNQQMQRTRSTLGMRRGWFVLALVLIAAGFLLQILGSWPGMR